MRSITSHMRNRNVTKVMYLLTLVIGVLALAPQARVEASLCHDCFDAIWNPPVVNEWCEFWSPYAYNCCVWNCMDEDWQTVGYVFEHDCDYSFCEQ
jgi:hypothetical protein